MAILKNPQDRHTLEQSLFCRGLSTSDLDLVIAQAHTLKLRKGAVLFHQADSASSTYLVLSGQLKLTQVTADGARTFLRILGPGQLLALISALEISTYPATAKAERPSVVMGWEGKTLDQLFLEVPGLARNGLRILYGRLREMQERFGELAAERTERRLARALSKLALQVGRPGLNGAIVLELTLSREELAEMIGTTLFSVSRILNQWKKNGWVLLGRQSITLTEPDALHRIAEEDVG
ncbi:hypothetical protein CYFUS_008620 [Cystobacter fuscus]|uniref:Crp/Fnr family transcriptional regulator n=1 Tax=Cystobacter fuscus TaxID=43 RepID=A0A250JHP3_9BACT|nr:Crp/Fnr family transcriptional regulator [Cystobacter fuscus]ATB43140.1 hypothetical protein CYFUS_008620 [Cystobacter fuscus]